MHTFNTYFLTTQYPFSILYLPSQIQMDIVYQKTGLKREFSRFLMYNFSTNINNHLICFEKIRIFFLNCLPMLKSDPIILISFRYQKELL